MYKRIAIATGILAAAMTTTTPAHAGPAGPEVPSRIAVEAGHKVFLVGHATGVQIFNCDGATWNFGGPRAVLRDDQRQSGRRLTSPGRPGRRRMAATSSASASTV